MGMCYSLYHPPTRTYFWLGKRLSGRDEDSPAFENDHVDDFISSRAYGEFVLGNDHSGGLDSQEEEKAVSDHRTTLDYAMWLRENPWREVTREECLALLQAGEQEKPVARYVPSMPKSP